MYLPWIFLKYIKSFGLVINSDGGATWNIELNPLTANDELSRHENLTFLWTWILRWVPRSFATHASLCNVLSSNKLCPKTVKILAVKGLKRTLFFIFLLPASNIFQIQTIFNLSFPVKYVSGIYDINHIERD